MNSVAIPASAPVGVISAEGDLIRQAARGDSESFEELFRRHGQMAWRLAQAVAGDRDAAVASVANGFVRAIHGTSRRKADREAGFRPAVLAAVYRHAIETARARAADRTAPVPAVASQGDATVAAAFRSLPERWRAALWLTEVESIAPERMAAILGVSAAAASQLIVRGTRGLAGRLAQAHAQMPEHLAPALRPVALAMPANLADVVAGAWGGVSSGPSARLAPLNVWLTERAVRPLQVSVVALIGLGVIGIGLVGEGASVVTPPVAAPLTPSGSVPYNLPVGGSGGSGGGAGGLSRGGSGGIPGLVINSTSSGGAGLASGAATSAAAGGLSAAGATGHGASGTAGSPGTTSPGSGAGSTTTTTQPTSTTTPTSIPNTSTTLPRSSPTTLVNLGPVASVTKSGGSTSVNVLPTKSGGSTATVTVNCGPGLIRIKLGSITIGCAAPSSSSTTTTTTLPIIGSLLGGL